MLPADRQGALADRPGARYPWGLLSVVVITMAAVGFWLRANFVDDAFTGFVYLDNLLAGHGFVFHPGQTPVEGVTNVGWLWFLLPLATAIGPLWAAKLLGCALLILATAMVMRVGQTLAAPASAAGAQASSEWTTAPAAAAAAPTLRAQLPLRSFGLTIVPAALLATSFEFVYFSLTGMETALLAVILLGMALLASRRPVSMALPILGAAGFLVHPEAALVYPLYLAISWGPAALARSPQRDGTEKIRAFPLARLAVFVGLIGGVTAARLVYFHDWAPNTFHAKPSGAGGVVANSYALLMGENRNIAFPVTGWLAIGLLAVGYRRLRRASLPTADMLLASCAAGIIFAVYSPADWTALPRYFAPYLPAALVLLWAGLLTAVECLLRRDRSRVALVAIAAVLLATAVFHSRAELAAMDQFPGYVLAGSELASPALWMRDHLPDGATIATRRIGAVAYYSGRPVFDYSYGLTDPEVARLVALHGGRFETPTDPALARVWLSRRPEYFLEDGLIMDYILDQSGGTRQRFLIHGIPYRVIREFPLGRDGHWILSQRM